MREKGRLVFSNLPQERITPAYAGKSRFEFFNKFIIWDHPRLCGEKKNISLEMIVILGSPPPMRGKGTSGMGRPRQAQDHPRLCGEKSDRSAPCFFKSGSPPPMRGKVRQIRHLLFQIRITPAYAGKSPRCRFCFLSLEDHHRLCGEKSICYDSTRPRPGSPPPMRGKAAVISPSKKFRRITPAYAGKSKCSGSTVTHTRDHPRLCGEKMVFCAGVGCWWGSPPPMRGKVLPMPASVRRTGITPAYAGKSYPPLVTRR